MTVALRPRLVSTGVVVGALLLGACTGVTEKARGEGPTTAASSSGTPSSVPAATPSTQSTAPSATPSDPSSADALPTAASPVSVPRLMRKEPDGRALRLGRVRARTDAYVQRAVTYRSDGLRISGIMNLPRGRGPFPVLVLLHGYIDPAIYVTGQGLRREQDYLARRGYAVLHTDYRNHAGSDDDPRAELRLRLDYAADAANAVRAVRRSDVAKLDGSRVGLLGRSMGGGVTYNTLVAQPGLVDAAVVFAPVSSRAEDNFERFVRGEREPLSQRVIERYGAPEDAPQFWREASARTYFDRITEPVLIHHGTSDDTCPIRWSRATTRAMERAGVDVRLVEYQGEEHAFVPQWPESMRRTVRFLDRELGVERA